MAATLRAEKLAQQIESFARSHGGSVEGQISYLGRRGARIVLVAKDGTWGDLVAPGMKIAREAAEQAGLALYEEFDAELANQIRTGPYEWSRMAGSQIGGPDNSP